MLKSLVSLSLLLAAASAQNTGAPNTRTFSRINITFTGTFNTGPNTGIPIPTTTRPPILSGDTGLLDVQCTQQYEPVCGTNGVTYGNACMLGVAVGNDASIAFLHEGECTPEYVCALPLVHGPCRRVAEERWGFDPKVGRCVTFEWACQGNGNNFLTEKDCAAFCGGPDRDLMQFDPINISIPQPAPTCDFQCLDVWNPVCGSDGVTYSNGCFLTLAACKNPKKNITVAHQGTCDGSGGSGGGAHTLQAGFTPCGIFCDQSPNDIPVCGSNGVTYGNACLLGAAACEDKRIRKVSDGPCPPPPCPDFCPLHYDPVCGTDGVTYGNSCELSLAACRNPKKNITVAHEGPCGGLGWPLALLEKADGKEDVTQQEDVAPANATDTDKVNLLCCPGQCCVAGFQEEMEFSRCMIRCRNGGGHHPGCYRTCCREVAGCSNCGFC